MNAKNFKEMLKDLRQDFHKYPEGSWLEFRTSSKIADFLFFLGYEVFLGKDILDPESILGMPNENLIRENIARALAQGAAKVWLDKMEGLTGVMGKLATGKPGPNIAVRFDIDANDLHEALVEGHRPYDLGFASINKGTMHACGHDGHITIGLGLAKLLIENKDKLRGNIILIFQPAEEGARGAKAIVNKGVLDDVNYFLSGHLGFNLPTGSIAVNPTGFLCSTKFDVEYIGKSAHAGLAPHEGKNALLAAANAVINLYGIAPHPQGMSRINVGMLEAGKARNIIPEGAFLKVETRGENSQINDYLFNRAQSIIAGAAKMHECDFTLEIKGETTDAQCDEELVALAKIAAKEIVEITDIINEFTFGASEDFTFMLQRVQEKGNKGIYVILGSQIAAGHHNAHFDFDETSLEIAVQLFYNLVLLLCL